MSDKNWVNLPLMQPGNHIAGAFGVVTAHVDQQGQDYPLIRGQRTTFVYVQRIVEMKRALAASHQVINKFLRSLGNSKTVALLLPKLRRNLFMT